MRHLWDKIDDTCKRCGLKRELEYSGDGFYSIRGKQYKYLVDNKWTLNLPECSGSKSISYEKLFDYSRLKK